MGTQDATQLYHSNLFAPELSTALIRDTRFTYTTPIHSLLQAYSTALFLEHNMPLIYIIFTLPFQHKFLPSLSYINGKFSSLFIYPNGSSRFLRNVSTHLPD
jgi:hypothetical protein